MLVLLVSVLGLGAALEDSLSTILQSPAATLQLYSNYKSKEHLAFRGTEDRFRFRLFRKSAVKVAAANSREGAGVKLALNLFSAMTPEEKRTYLGLNITGHLGGAVVEGAVLSRAKVPQEKLWVEGGHVTQVKQQGSCGSCWTFGAVGGIETRYSTTSGVLRAFSEQEYLSCVYEGLSRDGCNGGWPDEAYSYSLNHGGRLASAASYPYAMRDEPCRQDVPDAMVGAKITDFKSVGRTEKANIAALAGGSLAAAFQVTDYFMQYGSGVMRDETCSGWPNHAVTAVGYTPQFVLVKNSWGSGWGEQGFVRFARGYHNCELFKYSSFPVLTSTGKQDTAPADPATDYRPDDNKPDPEPCADWYDDCGAHHCQYADIAEKYCRKTCGKCADAECPSGTEKCPDGVCRHKHMC